MEYKLLAAILVILFFAAAVYYVIFPFIDLNGYYEIEPSFAELASLENMSLLLQGEDGVITTIGEDSSEILFKKKGNVFYSDIDHPLTNKELVFYKKANGILDIYSDDVHLASFVRDNMISMQFD